MRFPTMFSPIQIGGVTVPNRFVVPPMANNFSDPDGCLSQRSLAYYAARARGGFGLITIESAVVYEQAKGGPRKACLFADHTIDSFRRVAEACHSYGAKVSVQLQHAGPEGSSALTGHPLKAASPVPAACGREIPREMPRDEVYRLIECYGDAARRAQLAGLDMVEVHCAHGYLVSTFLSERTNHRTDEFGGCFENRLRLPRLIVENIRRKTGGIMPIPAASTPATSWTAVRASRTPPRWPPIWSRSAVWMPSMSPGRSTCGTSSCGRRDSSTGASAPRWWRRSSGR